MSHIKPWSLLLVLLSANNADCFPHDTRELCLFSLADLWTLMTYPQEHIQDFNIFFDGVLHLFSRKYFFKKTILEWTSRVVGMVPCYLQKHPLIPSTDDALWSIHISPSGTGVGLFALPSYPSQDCHHPPRASQLKFCLKLLTQFCSISLMEISSCLPPSFWRKAHWNLQKKMEQVTL